MPNNPKSLLLTSTLGLGIIISVSSSSWYGIWLGLEINLLSFVPLISHSLNQRITEAALKYFLVQAIASNIFLLRILILHDYQSSIIISIASSSLLIKIGSAPFHFWFPEVIEGLQWLHCLILITIQKIAPLTLIRYIPIPFFFLSLVIILSVIIGCLGGLNQTSIRKIIAFSSINHMGWILSTFLLEDNSWLVYLFMYIILTVTATITFIMLRLHHINQIFNVKLQPITKLAIFSSLMSLGGLPPFLGFFPKWVVIIKLANFSTFLILTVIIFTALLTLYFYLRIAFPVFTISSTHLYWLRNNSTKIYESTIISAAIIISTLGLLICPVITNYTI